MSENEKFFANKFAKLMRNYGSCLPLRDLNSSANLDKLETAMLALHKGWLQTTIAGDGKSILFKLTPEGYKIFPIDSRSKNLMQKVKLPTLGNVYVTKSSENRHWLWLSLTGWHYCTPEEDLLINDGASE